MGNTNGSSEQRCGNTDPHVLGLAACDALGITENLHGIDEIAAFRKGRPPANLARNVRRLDIVTFGRDYGSITLEFERNVDGKTVRGRQSQVWVRLPEGWESWRRMFPFFPDSLVVYPQSASGTRVDSNLPLSARANYHRRFLFKQHPPRNNIFAHLTRRLVTQIVDKSPLGSEFGNPSAVQKVGIQITDGVDLKNAFLIAEKLA